MRLTRLELAILSDQFNKLSYAWMGIHLPFKPLVDITEMTSLFSLDILQCLSKINTEHGPGDYPHTFVQFAKKVEPNVNCYFTVRLNAKYSHRSLEQPIYADVSKELNQYLITTYKLNRRRSNFFADLSAITSWCSTSTKLLTYLPSLHELTNKRYPMPVRKPNVPSTDPLIVARTNDCLAQLLLPPENLDKLSERAKSWNTFTDINK